MQLAWRDRPGIWMLGGKNCLCAVDFLISPRGVAGGEQTQLDCVAYLKEGRGILEAPQKEKDGGLF